MGRIVVAEFMALDGVYEDPSWTMQFGFDPAMGETMGSAVFGNARGLLLGRKTFEMFAPAWSTRTVDDDPAAPFFNDAPKHVVASTEPSVQWQNSTVIGGYDAGAIADLRARTDGDLYCTGSGTLVRALLSDGLVDELHLFVYPVLRGTGARLFVDGSPVHTLSLLASDRYDNGVLHLAYAPAAD